MSKQFTLGKDERLKSRKQIEKLFAEGKSFVVNPFRVYFIVNGQLSMVNNGSCLQFGVGVSNKNFKKAVDRNRIKRLLREAYRLHNYDLLEQFEGKSSGLSLFLIYVDKTLPTFETL